MTDFFRTDCRHFPSDRPCEPHKEKGVTCHNCTEHDPVTSRMLILKVGALGDVLRSTALLPALKNRSPRAHVTWVTNPAAFPFFDGNPDVDRLLPFSWETFVQLRQESFDEAWSLDFDASAAAWMPELHARDKRGFSYSNGRMAALNPEAQGWVDMSLDDVLKRKNSRTYQDWMFSICGLQRADQYEPRITLTEAEKNRARQRFGRRLSPSKRTLGLNTGAGGRWAQKKWTREGLETFLRSLKKEKNINVLLLGGPEEKTLNPLLARKFPEVIDTGCGNSLREFAAIVDLCGIVVTGDTVAMHVAIALRKRVVAFFGPTSAAEIELYGRGEKVFKDWDCLPCYRPQCVRSPNCMESLTAEEVLSAVRRQSLLSPVARDTARKTA